VPFRNFFAEKFNRGQIYDFHAAFQKNHMQERKENTPMDEIIPS